LVLRVIVLALAIAAVPVSGLAQEKSPPAARPGIQASIQKAVAATPVVPVRVKAARTQSSPPPPKPSFFKTPAGIAVLAIIGGGTGYALYSAKHDKLPKTPPYPIQ
jgi:hypothetical protein